MKTKSRGAITIHNFSGHSYQMDKITDVRKGGGVVARSYQSGALETITWDDTKRPKSDNTTRYCDHTKRRVEGYVIQEYYTRPETPNTYLDSLSGITSPVLPDLVAPNVSPYHGEALDFFKSGCVSQVIDLGANLAEIKQAVRLLPNLKETFGDLWMALRKKSVKYTLKRSADLHLSYSFGFSPLVADVSAIVNSVKALHNHISWLRRNSGKPVRVRFSKDLSALKPGNTTLFNTTQEIGWNIVTDFRATYQAYALIVYDTSALSDLELRLKYFVRQMGLDKPLSTAWELTPWSFVADWVFSIGQWLDRIAPAVTLPTKFLDLGYTVKVEQSDTYRLTRKYPVKGSKDTYELVTKRSVFTRRRGLPISFSSVVEKDDLSFRQLALSMSLALQKWR